MSDQPPTSQPPPASRRKPSWSTNLADLRKAKKISQKALADLIGASQTTVAAWETGQNQPSIETFERIAAALDVRPQELIFRTKDVGAIAGYIRDKKTNYKAALESDPELALKAVSLLTLALEIFVALKKEDLLGIFGSKDADITFHPVFKAIVAQAADVFDNYARDLSYKEALPKTVEETVARVRLVNSIMIDSLVRDDNTNNVD